MSYRVLVCGSRTFTDEASVEHHLRRVVDGRRDVVVVHGGAKGADTLGGRVARRLGLEVEVHEADWDTWGKVAGRVRNADMAASGLDFCLAFVDKPLKESKGTSHMVELCKLIGVTGKVVRK